MQTTLQALREGYEFVSTDKVNMIGYWRFEFGDDYALCVEPLIGGQFYVALYKGDELLTTKLTAQPVSIDDLPAPAMVTL